MKKLLAFLALSLAANAAFLVTFFVRPKPQVVVPNPATQPAATDTTSVVPAAAAAAGLASADLAALERTRGLVGGGDLRQLAARLRAAGFPEHQVRALVGAEISRVMQARRADVFRKLGSVPYWSANLRMSAERELSRQLGAIGREQTALIKSVLGPGDSEPDQINRAMLQRTWGDLPAEKVSRLQAIMNDYGEMRSQLFQNTGGMLVAEDRAKIDLLEKEQRADIEKLLTPEELEQYDLRTSGTSMRLRDRLAGFEVSEDEFRTLFRAYAAAEGLPVGNSRSFPSAAERDRANTALLAQIESTLGPERAAEFQKVTNPEYRQVSQLLNRLELPSSLAPGILSVQQDIQQRASAVRQDPALSSEDRASQLAALAGEAESRLSASLGPRGLSVYKQMSGQWLNQLTRPNQPRVNPLPAVRFQASPND
ncbi:MAG: hypothetical protein JSR48_11350 [Verrucomicrobia bacterium]|nr:hypothetical protein [Verrucomicrobiota bacterium]